MRPNDLQTWPSEFRRLIGDGTVHRAIADTQRRFFEPPQESGLNGAPKYRGSKHGG
jgi:hypothetical protein